MAGRLHRPARTLETDHRARSRTGPCSCPGRRTACREREVPVVQADPEPEHDRQPARRPRTAPGTAPGRARARRPPCREACLPPPPAPAGACPAGGAGLTVAAGLSPRTSCGSLHQLGGLRRGGVQRVLGLLPQQGRLVHGQLEPGRLHVAEARDRRQEVHGSMFLATAACVGVGDGASSRAELRAGIMPASAQSADCSLIQSMKIFAAWQLVVVGLLLAHQQEVVRVGPHRLLLEDLRERRDAAVELRRGRLEVVDLPDAVPGDRRSGRS